MPNINKVVYGNNTLIDLTGTTATADKIMEGYGAFGRDGAWMDGSKTIELQAKTVNPSTETQVIVPDLPDGVTVSDTLSTWAIDVGTNAGTTQEIVLTIKAGTESWVNTFPNIFHFYLNYGKQIWSNHEGYLSSGQINIDTAITLPDANFHVNIPVDDDWISAMWIAPSTNTQNKVSLFITFEDNLDSTSQMIIVDEGTGCTYENGWDTTAHSNAFRLYGLDENDFYDGLSQVTVNPVNNGGLRVTPTTAQQEFYIEESGCQGFEIAVFTQPENEGDLYGDFMGIYYNSPSWGDGVPFNSGTYEPNGEYTSLADIYNNNYIIVAAGLFGDNFGNITEVSFTYDTINNTAHGENNGIIVDIENDVITVTIPTFTGYSPVIVERIPSEYVVPMDTITIRKAGTTNVRSYASAYVAEAAVEVGTRAVDISDKVNLSVSEYASTATSVNIHAENTNISNITVVANCNQAGYVAAGEVDTGLKKVTLNKTLTLPAQPAATITPSTSSQTAITAGKFAAGDVTVAPIPSQYIIPSGSQTITTNGTYDISSKETVIINVPPQLIGNVYQDSENYVVLDNGNGAQTIIDPLLVTQNGTYNAPTGHAYSPVTVNVSGGGSASSLKIGALRPDAELVQTWSYDRYIVADEGVRIPEYTTTATTLRAATALTPTVSLDPTNYNYCVLIRYLVIPQYSTNTHGLGREEYYYGVGSYDLVYIDRSKICSKDGTPAETDLVSFQSTSNTNIIYWRDNANIAKTPQSFGAYVTFSSASPQISNDVLSLSSAPFMIRGSNNYLNQTYWNYLTDIRYQYVVELYRAPKDNSNVEGFWQNSQLNHLFECANSQNQKLT